MLVVESGYYLMFHDPGENRGNKEQLTIHVIQIISQPSLPLALSLLGSDDKGVDSVMMRGWITALAKSRARCWGLL